MSAIKNIIFVFFFSLLASQARAADDVWLHVYTFKEGDMIFWNPHSKRGNASRWSSKWKWVYSSDMPETLRIFTAVCKKSKSPGTVYMRNTKQTACEREECRKIIDERDWTIYAGDQLGSQICNVSRPY